MRTKDDSKNFEKNKYLLAEILSLSEVVKGHGHDLTVCWFSHVLSMKEHMVVLIKMLTAVLCEI